jgi:CBS domain-containing protein
MTLRALAYGPTPLSMAADTPVREVLRRMLEQRINHVALRGTDGRFAGLVSVQALLSRIIPSSARVDHGLADLAFAGDALPMLIDHFRDIAQQPAVSLVSEPITVLLDNTPIMEAALMLSRSQGPLPVVDTDGILAGVLSSRAMLAYLANQAEKT